MLVCVKCKQGLMDPIRLDDEPEYTDRYQCGHCGHIATIPSAIIVFSQIVCSLMGGSLTFYLLIQQIGIITQSLGSGEGLWGATLPALVGITFILGFVFTLQQGVRNLALRYRYKHAHQLQ